MSRKTKAGKMVIEIHPVSREEYDTIKRKIEFLAGVYLKQYHCRYLPAGSVKK